MNEWPKRCACGAVHTEAQWKTLRYVGVQIIPACGDEPEEHAELRDCECRSTLSIILTPVRCAS